MGQFLVAIDAVGNHGCEREIKDGKAVIGCEKPHCTDCMVRELVRRLKRSGATVAEATITHWPQQEVPIVDDLLTGIRKGSF